MAERAGIVYMRTTRGAYPVLYGPDEAFPIGGSKVVRSSADDQVTLIGAGVTLHNCLAAADQLGRGRHRRPGHRPVLGQADRHPDPAGRGRGPDRGPAGGRRGPLPRRAASAARCSRRSATRATRSASATWPSGTCPDPGRPQSSWRRPGYPPTRSPRPPAACSAADAVETPARGARLRRQACADVSTLISHSADVSGAGCSRRWSANRFTHARPGGLGHPRGHAHGAGKRPSERLAGRGGETEDSSVPGSS